MIVSSPYSWWSPFAYTATGLDVNNAGLYDPIQGDPLGFGNTGLFACTDPCNFTWPPEDDGGGIDWWGVLTQAWEFYNEVIRGSGDTDEDRRRRAQLNQSGAVTSGWFLLLVVGAVVAVVLFTSRGGS